jgi:acyl carrier protein
MKNVSKEMLKKAIFITEEKFENLIKELNGDEDDFYIENGYVSLSDEIRILLEKHFDIEISSIHADGFDNIGVWIIYK